VFHVTFHFCDSVRAAALLRITSYGTDLLHWSISLTTQLYCRTVAFPPKPVYRRVTYWRHLQNWNRDCYSHGESLIIRFAVAAISQWCRRYFFCLSHGSRRTFCVNFVMDSWFI